MKYTIRKFNKYDEREIVSFHSKIFPTENIYEAALCGGFKPTDGWGLYKDKLIGYAICNQKYLFFFGIDEKYRGRGLARFLLECVLLNYEKIQLDVKIDNKPAMALYLKLGFAPVEYKKNYYGPNSDGLLMERFREKK